LNRLQKLAGLSTAGLVFLQAAPSHAFCLTHTCDPKTEDCMYDTTGCNISGKPLYWASSTVSFDIQQDDSYELLPDGTFALDANGAKIVSISADALEQVVSNAFERWVNADCGKETHPSIRLKELPRVACSKPEYNKDQPNANVITFHDSAWPYPSNAQDTLALTTVFFDGDTGEIYDANVEINTNKDKFALASPAAGEFDLNAVLTHELGHFLGLSHSSVADATMYSSYAPGMTTLESDDVQAICTSLKPDRQTTGDSYTPRHGWSGECGSPESGCSCAAVGVTPRRAFGLWALALGLCAWRGRARLRRARALRG
jgi:hypothetical protein